MSDPKGVAFAIQVPSEDPAKKKEADKPEGEGDAKLSADEALKKAKAELKADSDELVRRSSSGGLFGSAVADAAYAHSIERGGSGSQGRLGTARRATQGQLVISALIDTSGSAKSAHACPHEQEQDVSLHRAALESLRVLIRTSTSSMTSCVPALPTKVP